MKEVLDSLENGEQNSLAGTQELWAGEQKMGPKVVWAQIVEGLSSSLRNTCVSDFIFV